MDLFSLSYRIQHNRYRVAPELVAEAIMRWHLHVREPAARDALEADPSRELTIDIHPAAGVDGTTHPAPAGSNGLPWRIEGPTSE